MKNTPEKSVEELRRGVTALEQEIDVLKLSLKRVRGKQSRAKPKKDEPLQPRMGQPA